MQYSGNFFCFAKGLGTNMKEMKRMQRNNPAKRRLQQAALADRVKVAAVKRRNQSKNREATQADLFQSG